MAGTRRVIIALDPDAPMEGALMAAVNLMNEGCELVGVYVEDENLHRLARLPSASNVSFATRRREPFVADDLAAALEHQAAGVRRTFLSAARRRQVRHSFQVERGEVLRIMADSGGGEADWVVIARSRRGRASAWVGTTWYRLAENPAFDALFINEPWESGRSVLVVYDGSPAAERALGYARAWSEREDLHLNVLRVGTADPSASLADIHYDLLEGEVSVKSLTGLCRVSDARVLVLPDTAGIPWQAMLPTLMEYLDCSLAVVHGGR